MKRAGWSSGIVATVLLVLATETVSAATTNWKNLGGTDWADPGNWDNGVPGGTDTATLPNANPVGQPTISDARSILNMDLPGSAATTYWNIGGAGTLTINGGSVVVNAKGATISCNVALNGDTTFSEGPWGFVTIVTLTGTLSGSGLLIDNEASGYTAYWGYLKYQNDAGPTFKGGTRVDPYGGVAWALNGNTGTYTFGLDAAGTSPGTITINGGAFGFVTTTSAGTLQELALDNSIVVNPAGGWLCPVQAGANTHITFSGPVTLNGPLGMSDKLPSSTASSASSPTATLGSQITLKRYARAILRAGDDGRVVDVTGNIVDEVASSPAPLIMLTLAGDVYPRIRANNAYAGGTVVDYCGRQSSAANPNARTEVSVAARLGTGNLTILPGGRIRWNDPQNLAAGAVINIVGNSMAAGVLSSTLNSVPSNLTNNNSRAVFAIDYTAGNFTAITDQSTVGDGAMFLGTTSASATLDLGTGTLQPGKGNTYRLGGGGAYSSTQHSIPGTLTVNAILTDIGGNTALQVGQNAWHGQGGVSLTKINTFKGPLDVWYPATWYNQAGSYYGFAYLQGKAQQSPTAGSPFGDSAGVVNLHGAGIQLNQAGTSGTSTEVTKGHLTFEGRNELRVSAANILTPFTLGIDANSRTNGGMLLLYGNASSLQNLERIIVASGTPPGYLNGIAAPYILVSASDFAAYDATLSGGYAKGFAAFTGYVTLSSLGGAGGGDGSQVVSQPALALAGDYNVYALKTTGALTSDGVADRTIIVASGGLILGGNIGANAAAHQVNLNFGSTEGIIYGNSTIYGKISGTKGFAVVTGLNSGALTVANSGNDFTGTITINPAGLKPNLDSGTGIGSLGPDTNGLYFNGGMLYINGGDRLLANRTVTLGPLGGYLNGNMTVFGRVTGPGILTTVNGTLTMANDGTGTGGAASAPNDYTGGTRAFFNGRLTVNDGVSLGAGDLMLEPGASATLKGNANLAASAKADIPYGATVSFTGTAPAFGNLMGSGDIVLGNNNVNDTTLTLGGDNSSSAFYGVIRQVNATAGKGKGSLTKTGNGTLTLYGTHAYTGDTTVSGGKLALMGSLAGNALVASGGTLGGRGGLVDGTLTINVGGKLAIELRGDLDYDSVNVTGAATLNGALEVTKAAGYNPPKGTKWTIVNTVGGVAMNFSSVTDGYQARRISGTMVELSNPPKGTVLFVM